MSGRTGGGGNKRGGGVEKPWASGRILTPEQRARKQEADRKANRFLKKEVQDRLTVLEARVLELEKPASNSTDVDTKHESHDDDQHADTSGVETISRPDAGNEQSIKGVNWNIVGTFPMCPGTGSFVERDAKESRNTRWWPTRLRNGSA